MTDSDRHASEKHDWHAPTLTLLGDTRDLTEKGVNMVNGDGTPGETS